MIIVLHCIVGHVGSNFCVVTDQGTALVIEPTGNYRKQEFFLELDNFVPSKEYKSLSTFRQSDRANP